MTDLVTKPGLEDRTVSLGPFLGDTSMINPQLQQVSEDGNTRNLGNALDLGGFSRAEYSVEDEEGRENGDAKNLVGHDECLSHRGVISKLAMERFASHWHVSFKESVQALKGAGGDRV